MFWFFGHKACGILVPWPGTEPASPALEGEVLTTGLLGQSLLLLIQFEKKKSSGSQTLALPQSPRELVKIHIFKVWEFKILTSSQSMLMVPVWGLHSNTMALSYNTTHLWRLFSPFGDFISLLMSQHRYRWMISERQLQ